MKKIGISLGLMALLGLLTACSAATKEADAEKRGEEPSQTVVAVEEVTVVQKEKEIITISDTQKEFHLYRDNLRIQGELHMPQGEGPFPVVVLATGFGETFDYQMDYVKLLNEKGIAAVVFDFIGTRGRSLSGGTVFDRTLPSHAADLNVVLDEVLTWSEIDSSKLFLWGHSFGGLVSTYVAGERAEEIQGLILLEPSYYMPDQYRELFPEGAEIPVMVEVPLPVGRKFIETIKEYDVFDSMEKYWNEVLIFLGTVHGDEELEMMASYFGKALETYPNAQLQEVEGADHYFQGDHGVSVTEMAIQFIEDILKEKE